MGSQVLVTRQSKRPNRNFRTWGGKNGWNFQEGYFRDHRRHVPEWNSLQSKNLEIWPISSYLKMQSQILVARQSKRPNQNFRPRGGKNGWNFHEGYFWDHWRHVSERNSLSRAKTWKFDPFPGNFTHFGRPTPENFDSVFLTVVRPEPGIAFWGTTKWVKFPNFCPGERILLPNMTPVVSKVSSWKFHPFWSPHGQKLRIGLFDRRATRNCLKKARLKSG